MSKRARKIQVIETPAGDGDDAPSVQEMAEDLERESIAEIADLLQSERLNSGTIKLKRVSPRGDEYVATISVDHYKERGDEGIAEDYGGGQYRLIFHASNGQFVTQKTIRIDARRKGKLDQVEPGPPDASGSALLQAIAKLSPPQDKEATFLKMLELQQNQSNQFMQAMQTANASMITAITSMVAALKPAATEGGGKGLDLLTALQVFDKLKPTSSAGDTLKVLEFAHRLIMERKDEEEDEGWFEKLIRGIAPMLIGGMQQPGSMQPQPWQPPALPPAEVQSPSVQSPSQPATHNQQPANSDNPQPTGTETVQMESEAAPMNIEDQIRFTAKQVLPMLLFKASTGATPEDVAELAANPALLNDEQFDALVALLRKDDWPKQIFGSVSAIMLQRKWFDRLREEIIKIADAPDDEDENAEADRDAESR